MRPCPRFAAVALALACACGAARADKKKRKAEEAESAPAPAAVEPAPAAAAEPVTPSPPPKATGRPILTLHLYEEDAPTAPLSDVIAGFAEALAKSDRVAFVDLPDLLESPEAARDALAAADRGVKEAADAFEQMDLDSARTKVEAAIKSYERYLPRLAAEESGPRRMRDAWIRLAAVRFFNGDNDGARDALRHTYVFDPRLDYTPKLFPPQMKKAVIESRLLFDALGSSKLSVTSEPPGALVYVNGSPHGTTPCTVLDVAAGPNYVTVVKRGFAPSVSVVEIAGGGEEAKAEVTLARYDSDPVVPLAKAREELGAKVAPASLADGLRRLGVPLVAATRMSTAGDSLTLTAYLYDARPQRLLKKVTKSGPLARATDTARALAGELLDGVRLDGVYKEEEPPKSPSLLSRLGQSFAEARSSKYFWPAVAVVAGVIVVGAVVAIAAAAYRPGLSPGQQLVLLGF